MKTQSVEGDPRPDSLGFSDAALSALLTDLYAQEKNALLDALEDVPSFDPIVIRDLIRDASAEGKHPARIILGHQEAQAYRDFLWIEYEEVAPKNLKDSYFLGLQIVEEDIESKVALAGEKPHDAWDGQLPPPWRDDNTPSGSADRAA